ncbi:MAG TPA: hypothetical protein VK599_00040 [Streptosporangiaceae bacterium]|nr:hypothetical protein [Streptosporangiaceae bacterium]
MATSKTSKAAAAARQFPAKAGHPDVEVDERSTDGSDGLRHIKQFVVLARDYYDDAAAHLANAAAVANEAIQRGLHPRGDVRFDGAEDHPDGHSVTLTYSVETVPSSIDHTPGDTTTPHDIITGDGA